LARDEIDEACWLVTNGERTVGPVCMAALLDAFERGTLSSDCLARKPEWLEWRALTQLREVCAHAAPADGASRSPRGRSCETWIEELLSSASDRSEVVHLALQAAVCVTGASLGWAHRKSRRRGTFFTMCQVGPVPDRLGSPGPSLKDPVLARATRGEVVSGTVHSGAAEESIAHRLGVERPVRGVAMLPVLGPKSSGASSRSHALITRFEAMTARCWSW
jgi:hypothetical protein